MPEYIKVIVKKNQAENVFVRTGTTNNRNWRIASQKAWLFLDDDFPTEMALQLPEDLQRIEPGAYSIDLDSIKGALKRGRFDRVELDTANLTLKPLDQAAVSPAFTMSGGNTKKTA